MNMLDLKRIIFQSFEAMSEIQAEQKNKGNMVGLGVGAARHHGVSHHRHHSHTDKARLDKDKSDKDGEGIRCIQGPSNGLLPPPSERILTGVLEKKTMTSKGLHWKKRNAVLSIDYLSFGKLVEDWYVRARRWACRAKFADVHAPSHH